jgi:hypothetical protein
MERGADARVRQPQWNAGKDKPSICAGVLGTFPFFLSLCHAACCGGVWVLAQVERGADDGWSSGDHRPFWDWRWVTYKVFAMLPSKLFSCCSPNRIPQTTGVLQAPLVVWAAMMS